MRKNFHLVECNVATLKSLLTSRVHPDNQTAVITVASASRRILNVLDIARTRYTLQCRKQQFLRIIVSGRQ